MFETKHLVEESKAVGAETTRELYIKESDVKVETKEELSSIETEITHIKIEICVEEVGPEANNELHAEDTVDGETECMENTTADEEQRESCVESIECAPLLSSLPMNKSLGKGLVKDKEFTCHYCDYKSNQKISVINHIRTHTGERPFACSYCQYKSSQRSSLVRHERIHTGEKPYACTYCDYRTSYKMHLTRHVRRRHTGEKRYACKECDYKSSDESSLVRHKRIHTGEKPFACNQCEYKSNDKSSLRIHYRQHTGETPFGCEFCDFRSKQKVHLLAHQRIHTGEKKS